MARIKPHVAPDRRIIRIDEALAITGMSRSSFLRLSDQGKFSKIRIGTRAVGWWLDELLACIEHSRVPPKTPATSGSEA
jgi:predicted DNA-binding transcriptional regulator AlpA